MLKIDIINLNFKFFIIYLFLLDSMIGLIMGLNELTYWLTLLNSIIIPIIILTTNSKVLIEFLFILGLILMISFSTLNLFIWYITFEVVLIPMIYIISKGSASITSRYRALMRFTLYTLFSGLLLLFSLLIIYINTGSFSYWTYILTNPFNYSLEILIFPINLIPYLVKLPIIPFHLWLPN